MLKSGRARTFSNVHVIFELGWTEIDRLPDGRSTLLGTGQLIELSDHAGASAWEIVYVPAGTFVKTRCRKSVASASSSSENGPRSPEYAKSCGPLGSEFSTIVTVEGPLTRPSARS